jgi:hypothetical protein
VGRGVQSWKEITSGGRRTKYMNTIVLIDNRSLQVRGPKVIIWVRSETFIKITIISFVRIRIWSFCVNVSASPTLTAFGVSFSTLKIEVNKFFLHVDVSPPSLMASYLRNLQSWCQASFNIRVSIFSTQEQAGGPPFPPIAYEMHSLICLRPSYITTRSVLRGLDNLGVRGISCVSSSCLNRNRYST